MAAWWSAPSGCSSPCLLFSQSIINLYGEGTKGIMARGFLWRKPSGLLWIRESMVEGVAQIRGVPAAVSCQGTELSGTIKILCKCPGGVPSKSVSMKRASDEEIYSRTRRGGRCVYNIDARCSHTQSELVDSVYLMSSF